MIRFGTTLGSGLLGQVIGRVMPLAVVTLLVIWFTVAYVSERVFEAESHAKLAARAEDQVRATTARLDDLVTTIRDLAGNDVIVNSLIDPDAEKTYLNALLRSIAIEGFSRIPVVLADYKARPITGTHLSTWQERDLEMWNEKVGQGLSVVDVRETGLVLVVPVYITNFVEGMLAVQFSPSQLESIVSPLIDSTRVEILGSDGYPIGFATAPAETALSTAAREGPVPHSDGLRLRTTVQADDDERQSTYFQWFMLAAFLLDLVALICGILAAVLLVTKPLRTFIRHLDRSRGRDKVELFDTRTGPSEISRLAHAFNRFVESEKEMLRDRSLQAERLAKALDREREVNVMQRQFVSLVSHEFRTPLTIIDGNAQRVAKRAGRLDADRLAQSMQIIRNTVTSLTDLMESVLSTAKLDEGQIEFEPTACDLGHMVQSVCDDYQQISARHQISADLAHLPNEVPADAKLLRQVFSNLISNAIKYSPESTLVEVVGWRTDREVIVSVRDHGRGIPESELNRLFERFFRASTSTGISGTGIGLHLVKHVVELHGGHVEVTSKVNEGTTFFVHLPKRAECAAPRPADARSRAA